MTRTMLATQFALPLLSLLATAFAQWDVLNTRFNARRYAPLVGLSVQPFWAYSALHTAPLQPGVLVTCAFFTLMWLVGFWEQWVAPWASPVWQAMRDGEWGLWWYRSYETQAFLEGFPDTEIDAEQWARHAGPPADGLGAAFRADERYDNYEHAMRLTTEKFIERMKLDDWCDTQPGEHSPDGVPWEDRERRRWNDARNQAMSGMLSADLTNAIYMTDYQLRAIQNVDTAIEWDTSAASRIWKPGPFDAHQPRIQPHAAHEERLLKK